MHATHEVQMKQMLQTLVEKGQITQAQADARLKFMQEKMQNDQGKARKMGKGMGMMGMGGHMF